MNFYYQKFNISPDKLSARLASIDEPQKTEDLAEESMFDRIRAFNKSSKTIVVKRARQNNLTDQKINTLDLEQDSKTEREVLRLLNKSSHHQQAF